MSWRTSVGPRREHRHAGEARELVHQVLEPVDLVDDRLGALRHQALLARGAGQAPAQPLGGELDRRQRVLDLVGDPLRHLAPRRHPLGLQELGQVVEDHDGARVLAVRARAAPLPRRRGRAWRRSAAAGTRAPCWSPAGAACGAPARPRPGAPGRAKTSSRNRPTAVVSFTPSIRAAARLMVVRRPSGSKETTPVVMASRTVSM